MRTRNCFYSLSIVSCLCIFGCSSPELQKDSWKEKYVNVFRPRFEISIGDGSVLADVQKGQSPEDPLLISDAKERSEIFLRYRIIRNLIQSGAEVDPSDPDTSDYSIGLKILDLGKIRTSVILWSAASGVATGLLSAAITGSETIGWSVLGFEIVEESFYPLAAIYFLKDYVCLATVEATLFDKQGRVLYSSEYFSFYNPDYKENISKYRQNKRETLVEASLSKVAEEIVADFSEVLPDLESQRMEKNASDALSF